MPNDGRFNSAFYVPNEIADALKNPELAKAIKQDYSQMRRIANRRLENFKGTEWESSKQYKMNAGKYKPLSEIKSDKELAHLLSDLHKFTSSKTSTVTGLKEQRNQAVEVLRERGYDFINNKNIKAFGDFMEDLRQRKIAGLYDSERLAEIFETAEREKVDPKTVAERFTDYERKQADLPPEQRSKNRRASSADLWKGINNGDLYGEGRPSASRKKRRNG